MNALSSIDIEEIEEIEEIGMELPLIDDEDVDIGFSQENKSIFLEDVRMTLSDECCSSGVRHTVLFANAAGRVGNKITILNYDFMQRIPEAIRNFSAIRETLDGVEPENLECWIELHHGHVPVGILVTHWKATNDPNPYFMLRRFHLDRKDNAPYIAIWRGSDFMNSTPLANCVNFSHVATDRNRQPVPLLPSMKKGALSIVAIAWAAMAYRLNPSILPGIDQTVINKDLLAA